MLKILDGDICVRCRILETALYFDLSEAHPFFYAHTQDLLIVAPLVKNHKLLGMHFITK